MLYKHICFINTPNSSVCRILQFEVFVRVMTYTISSHLHFKGTFCVGYFIKVTDLIYDIEKIQYLLYFIYFIISNSER